MKKFSIILLLLLAKNSFSQNFKLPQGTVDDFSNCIYKGYMNDGNFRGIIRSGLIQMEYSITDAEDIMRQLPKISKHRKEIFKIISSYAGSNYDFLLMNILSLNVRPSNAKILSDYIYNRQYETPEDIALDKKKQEEEQKIIKQQNEYEVEEPPEFEGGVEQFWSYMSKNLKYPVKALRANTTGRVYVRFIVEADGQITDAHVERGIGNGCDEEALRVIRLMPRWKPAMTKSGRFISQPYTIPVPFLLE